MTNFETVANTPAPDAQVKRDRWGRYVIPHPLTGQQMSWTRATTLASTLADRFGLEQWAKRNVALGLGARHDLYAQAASCKPDDKTTLNRIVEQAEEAAKSKAGANLGTALHRFTERLDAGEDIQAPPPWDKDLAAYWEAMETHDIAVLGNWIERILIVPELQVAGTCDRICSTMGWQLPRIADLKTGKDVIQYGMVEIALQLAIYSRATHWYDPVTDDTHQLDIAIDQTRAIVMHLPVGQAQCTIYQVDISAGWEAVQLAVAVRDWRKRKDLAQQLVPTVLTPPAGDLRGPMESAAGRDRAVEPEPSDPPVPALSTSRLHWIQARVQAIKDSGLDAYRHLVHLWNQHPDIPTFKQGGPVNNAQIDAIAEMCDQVEANSDLPFPPPDPDLPKQTKTTRRS